MRKRGRPKGKTLIGLVAFEEMCKLNDAGETRPWTLARLVVDAGGEPLGNSSRRATIERLALFWMDRQEKYADLVWDPVSESYKKK